MEDELMIIQEFRKKDMKGKSKLRKNKQGI